jgi:hypothetical protein
MSLHAQDLHAQDLHAQDLHAQDLHAQDLHAQEQLLAAVAAALGESIALIRRRGFHLERDSHEADLWPARRGAVGLPTEVDDAVDLAAYGLDWDADDDSRITRRWRGTARRRRAA